jgi:broad specificity phosphatase PhoE
MEKIREEMAELFRDRLRVSVARIGQSYQKLYDHGFDTVPCPQRTRIPNFSKFSSESGRSTHERVGQFLAHLAELADGKAFRVCLFSLSLTGTAFTWYIALPPNSINSWNDLESKFHEHSFSEEYELGLANLASVR